MSESSDWKDIWEDDPPRYEDIYFKLGDGSIHLGQCQGYEKLRKCDFLDYKEKKYYECCKNLPVSERVIEWKECPEEEV